MQDDEPFGHVPEPDGDDDVDPLLPEELISLDDGERSPEDLATSSRVPHRYRTSIGASALAAGMIGLRDVLEDPKDDRPVVEQFADEGDRDRPVEVDLDPDEPSASVVRLRPDA